VLRDRVVKEILPNLLNDRVKARELQPDGSYRRLKPEGNEPRAQAQWHFRERSREQTKKQSKAKKKSGIRLIPITEAKAKL
jgi:polyphosphate kinase